MFCCLVFSDIFLFVLSGLCCAVACCAVACCVVLGWVACCCPVLCCVVLGCVVLHGAALCCVVWFCVVLCSVVVRSCRVAFSLILFFCQVFWWAYCSYGWSACLTEVLMTPLRPIPPQYAKPRQCRGSSVLRHTSLLAVPLTGAPIRVPFLCPDKSYSLQHTACHDTLCTFLFFSRVSQCGIVELSAPLTNAKYPLLLAYLFCTTMSIYFLRHFSVVTPPPPPPTPNSFTVSYRRAFSLARQKLRVPLSLAPYMLSCATTSVLYLFFMTLLCCTPPPPSIPG